MDFTPCLYLPGIMVTPLVSEFNERNWGAGWKAVDLFSQKVRLEILFSLISPFVGM